jgi:hypothetical protein
MNGKAEPMLTAIEGVDSENPGSTLNRSGKPIPVPRTMWHLGKCKQWRKGQISCAGSSVTIRRAAA